MSAKKKIGKTLVKDATKSIMLHITRGDVKGSKKMDPARCAAAIALKRELKCAEVLVFLTKTYIKQEDGNGWTRYSTPEALRREITSFDRTSYFEPGTYHLPPVAPSNRLGLHPGGRKSDVGRKKVFHRHFTKNVRERGKVPD